VPLNSTSVEKGGQLLGATSHPTEGEADPLGKRVLNRGEAIVAPRGRADDFSWPRPDISGTADTEALPDAVLPKGAAANSGAEDGEKNTDKAATTKSSEATNRPTQSSPTVTTTRPHRHVDQVNGAPPRPPSPVGPAYVELEIEGEPPEFHHLLSEAYRRREGGSPI
jgi:hypothetical protein